MDEITRLPETARQFTANGKTFIIHESTTVDGYTALEELKIRAATGDTATALLERLQEVYDLMNKGRFADAAVAMYNTIDAGEKIAAKRPHSLLLQLTIFARPLGHDVREWSEELAMTWIDDWQQEGIDVTDLFSQAGGSLMRFQLASSLNSRNTSEFGNESEEGEAEK